MVVVCCVLMWDGGGQLGSRGDPEKTEGQPQGSGQQAFLEVEGRTPSRPSPTPGQTASTGSPAECLGWRSLGKWLA